MALYPYPALSDCPEAAGVVLQFLRGSGVLSHAVHAAEVLAAYGLSVALPDNAMGAPPRVLAIGRQEVERQLEAIAAAGPAGVQALPPIPWGSLAAFLLQLLSQWLSGG